MDRFSQFLAFSKGKERRKPSLQESDDIKSCKVVLTFEAFDEPFKDLQMKPRSLTILESFRNACSKLKKTPRKAPFYIFHLKMDGYLYKRRLSPLPIAK